MREVKTVFDIWNDSIKGIIFGNDEWKDIILVKQIEQTQGLRKWKILDSEAFAGSINKILEVFVKKLWWDFIDEVFVWISHPEMIVTRIIEQKRIMTDEIQAEDVEHLSRIVSEISNKNNYETIKIFYANIKGSTIRCCGWKS